MLFVPKKCVPKKLTRLYILNLLQAPYCFPAGAKMISTGFKLFECEHYCEITVSSYEIQLLFKISFAYFDKCQKD